MAKQIRLLATYPNPGGGFFSPGTTITVSDAEATQLVQNKNATYDLTGGTTVFQPAPGSNLSPIDSVPASQVISAGQTTTVMLPAGAVLGFNATADVVGTRQMVNPNGDVISSQDLSQGDSAVGPFLLDTRVRFNVSFGTVTTKPGVTPGAVDAAPLFARIDNLEAGDDEIQDWKRTVDAGLQSADVRPIQTAAGPMPNSRVPLGTAAALGDYLASVTPVVYDNTNAEIILEDGTESDVIGGTGGTAPAAPATTISLVRSPSAAITANQFAGQMLWVTYTPTGAGRTITFMKRIVSHPANATTGFDPVLPNNLPAGATVTAWGVRPKGAAYVLASFNQTGAPLKLGRQATKTGGFRLSVGSGVDALVGGQFTW